MPRILADSERLLAICVDYLLAFTPQANENAEEDSQSQDEHPAVPLLDASTRKSVEKVGRLTSSLASVHFLAHAESVRDLSHIFARHSLINTVRFRQN